jgi:hypothetical protein
MQSGTPKFNAIAALEGSFSFSALGAALNVKAAFVDTKTGHTHGWMTGAGLTWSKQTMDALNQLRDSMEADLARLHFEDGTVGTVEKSSGVSSPSPALGGLNEHLGSGGEDASQV